MTTTPDPRQEPTAAQLIAIALGTSPPAPAEPVSSRAVDAVQVEARPVDPPTSPA